MLFFVQSNVMDIIPLGASLSVALKQFSPSSCIQELMRKETYLLTKTYVMQNIFMQL